MIKLLCFLILYKYIFRFFSFYQFLYHYFNVIFTLNDKLNLSIKLINLHNKNKQRILYQKS